MQRFMHASVASAHTADSLTTAFTLIAGMSPDPAWSWVAIATRGANLANAGDLAGAKGQCVACHQAYREAYRAQYRLRPL
jgi:cytochrome c553